MALTSLDERDLLLPLYQGIHETPAWETFLRRLLARTGAAQVCLLMRRSPVAAHPPVLRVASVQAGRADPDFDRLAQEGILPLSSLRPNRVYALEELIDPAGREAAKRQRDILKQADIAHARFIRIAARGERDAWLVLLQDRKPFAASDSALLTSIAPHLASAIATLAELDSARLRAAMAEDALALLGIGQAALDREGRVVANDALALELLEATVPNRLPLASGKVQDLARACASLGGKPAAARQVVRIDHRRARDLLLRPFPGGGPEGAATVIASVRRSQRVPSRASAPVVARLLGLSEREAALADAISHGQAITEAGHALQLTQETARNYSKRIYAKTGATGQADLVRMVLTGLAQLA